MSLAILSLRIPLLAALLGDTAGDDGGYTNLRYRRESLLKDLKKFGHGRPSRVRKARKLVASFGSAYNPQNVARNNSSAGALCVWTLAVITEGEGEDMGTQKLECEEGDSDHYSTESDSDIEDENDYLKVRHLLRIWTWCCVFACLQVHVQLPFPVMRLHSSASNCPLRIVLIIDTSGHQNNGLGRSD